MFDVSRKSSKKFGKSDTVGKRLKQNYIKLRQTKLDQYHVTLPKGVVEAIGFSKGDVFKVILVDGNITLVKDDMGDTW